MKKVSIFGMEVNFLVFFFGILLIITLMGGCSYRVWWLESIENYELAYKWDRADGSITPVKHSGWARVTPFFTKIYTVDSRPMQIRIESNLGTTSGVNNRILNAKLVQFDPKGYSQFFSYHGLADYDQANLSEILKIYAYEGCATNNYNTDSLQKKYHFLKILGETSAVSGKSNSKDSTNAKN